MESSLPLSLSLSLSFPLLSMTKAREETKKSREFLPLLLNIRWQSMLVKLNFWTMSLWICCLFKRYESLFFFLFFFFLIPGDPLCSRLSDHLWKGISPEDFLIIELFRLIFNGTWRWAIDKDLFWDAQLFFNSPDERFSTAIQLVIRWLNLDR